MWPFPHFNDCTPSGIYGKQIKLQLQLQLPVMLCKYSRIQCSSVSTRALLFLKVPTLWKCCWNDIDRKTEVLGERPIPVPLCLPQILH